MFTIPTVLTAQELTDKVLRRASKVTVDDRSAFYRIKKLSIGRLDAIDGNLESTLSRYINTFPSMDMEARTVDLDKFFLSYTKKHRLEITTDDIRYLSSQQARFSQFYFELIDVSVGALEIKQALASMQWARKKSHEIILKKQQQIRKMGTVPPMDTARKEAIGRVTSIIKDIRKSLLLLAEAREMLKKLPTLSPGAPICVIAGFPNVGKSSFLKQVSKARPEIASYPFTTRGINMGVHEIPRDSARGILGSRINLVDTPGLLDREPEERNAIEEQAAAALRHVADCVLFILDPSEFCGYGMVAQQNLLDRLLELFPGIPFVIAENKSDVKRTESEHMKMSTLTGEGVPEAMATIKHTIFPDQE